MLGFADISVFLAWILIILLTLISVIYGLVNWNKGGDVSEEELAEEKQWMKDEIALDEKVDGGVS